MALGVEGFRVGTWTAEGGHTGCTVVLPPSGSLGSIAVRGGAPGTREAAALGATGKITECHGVVLSGGSAFGLATADGVSGWCEEQGIGYDVGVARVPIIGAAIVFDLRDGQAQRPDAAAGRAACEAANEDDPQMGGVGVGAGCTVGKTAGLEFAAASGQGWAVARGGGVTVGALIGVNALGDVLDERGEVLLGSTAPGHQPRYPFVELARPATQNTVIGCLVTDALLTKAEAVRVADLAHSGIARSITPAHTSFDGDALFLLCAQRVPATVDLVAHLGAEAVAGAIRAAAHAAKAAG